MEIAGNRVSIRDHRRESDHEDFLRWLNLEEWQYYDEPDAFFKPVSRDEYERRRQQRQDSPAGSHNWQVDTIEGEHIGWVNYYGLEQDRGVAYVGICLPEEETWGRGYGTEALLLLIDYMFQKMRLVEIRIATWSGNLRMIRCAEKCGFVEAWRGPHRSEVSIRGEPLERVEFSGRFNEWNPGDREVA